MRADADGHQDGQCILNPTPEQVAEIVSHIKLPPIGDPLGLSLLAHPPALASKDESGMMFSKDQEAGQAAAAAKGAIKKATGTNEEAEEAISSGAATGADAKKLAQHVGEQKAGIEATKAAVGALAGAKGKDAKEKALTEVNKQVGLLNGHTKDIQHQLNKIKKNQ